MTERKTIITIYLLMSLLAFFVIVYIVARFAYNKFVDKTHFLDIAYDNLEVEKQRRYDVVIHSVKAAREYLNIEGQILEYLVTLNGIIENNNTDVNKEKVKSQILELVSKLDAIVENYPEIKTDGPYTFLIKTIKNADMRVRYKRLIYNKKVHDYNLFCRLFPYNYFARLYGYHNIPFFQADKQAYKHLF
ncbi:MAG: LemA family protein [Nitrospinae bacterium]|nr:LemA family protein [Nitrospinota bacterium]